MNTWKIFDGRTRQAFPIPCDTRWEALLSCVAFPTQSFKPLLALLKTLKQGTYVEKAVNLRGHSALITEMGHFYSSEFVNEAITLSEASDFSVSKARILLESIFSRLKDAAENGNPIAARAHRKFIEVYEENAGLRQALLISGGTGGTYASINFQKRPVFWSMWRDFLPC